MKLVFGIDRHLLKELQLYLLCRETIRKYLWDVYYLRLVELGEHNEALSFANLCHNENFYIPTMTRM